MSQPIRIDSFTVQSTPKVLDPSLADQTTSQNKVPVVFSAKEPAVLPRSQPKKNKKVSADAYRPKQSQRLSFSVPNDQDVWVERSYESSQERKILYYTSVNTGHTQLLEPPSGATLIVRETMYHQNQTATDDLPECIQQIVNKKLSIQELRAIPKPEPMKTSKPRRRRVKRFLFVGRRRQGEGKK